MSNIAASSSVLVYPKNSKPPSNFPPPIANYYPIIWGDYFLSHVPTIKLRAYPLSSSLPIIAEDEKPPSNLPRPIANYHPTVWGDYFLSYVPTSEELDHQETETQIETLKKEISKLLVSTTEPLAKVDLIDSICRLGVNYHFEQEIEENLQYIYKSYVVNGEITLGDNLCPLAVLFRLLRQHGFHVSPLVFNKFKDVKGNFSERLISDVEGTLSLYEAAHMRIHGEDILEEALVFTSTHLERIVTKLNPSLAAQVNHSLRLPLHKNLPRLEARRYISIYEQDPCHNQILITFSKLDFNRLQNVYKKEFSNICKWWNELDVPTKLPYVRDRIVELCFWISTICFEPQYSQAREILTKVAAMITILDDTYDAYGTIDELQILTEAIDRWDINCLDDLPDYMKIVYKTLIEVYDEIEDEMKKQRRTFCVNYGIKEMKKVVQAYIIEARWFNNKYIPTTEEYLHTSAITSCYSLMTTMSYIGMGDTATENLFEWVANEPKILKSSSILCRLVDDKATSQFEQKRGHVSSFLECYMSQYGVSKEEAIRECHKRIKNAWKEINEECLRPTSVPMPFLIPILNFSRFMNIFYRDDEDNYTNSEGLMKIYVKALVIDPVPL